MQTESHSDCPTSQAKRWKTFTCKYEWPTSYHEYVSYGILHAQQPQKTRHRGLANQQFYHTGFRSRRYVCGISIIFAIVAYWFVTAIVSPHIKWKWMLMNSDWDIMYCINRFAAKQLKSFLPFLHGSSVYGTSSILLKSLYRRQQR